MGVFEHASTNVAAHPGCGLACLVVDERIGENSGVSWRGWVGAAVGLVTVSVAWLLVSRLFWPDESPAAVLVVPAVLVAGVPAVLELRRRRALDEAAALDQLRRVVRLDREQFLRVSVRLMHREERPTLRLAEVDFGAPAQGTLPAEAEAMLLRWQEVGDHTVQGSLATAGEYFRSLPAGRLVIMGTPGSGKTVLASQLLLQLLEPSAAATGASDSAAGAARWRVPVWVPLTSYYPPDDLASRNDEQVHAHFQAWFVEQITAATRLQPKTVLALVASGRLLPVLDGLDEMLPSDSRLVVRALNTALDPVVITTRIGDYAQLAAGDQGQVLVDARHIVLQPLAAEAVGEYLVARYPTPSGGVDRWQPVRDSLATPGHWLQSFLGRPWHLYLVTTNFDQTDTDPADLLTVGPERVTMTLLSGLVPAITRHNHTATERGWTSQRIEAWLTALATHINRSGPSRTAIALPETWRLAGAWPRWVLPGFLGAGAVSTGVIGVYTRHWWLIGLALNIALLGPLTARRFARVGRLDLHKSVFRQLAKSVAGGLAFGLTFGLTIWLMTRLTFELVYALAFGLVCGLGYGLAGDPLPVRPSKVIRQALSYTVALGLAGGLASGLVFGLAFGLEFGLALGLKAGLGFGLGSGLVSGLGLGYGWVWLRYFLGVMWAARRGACPERLARFLDWALDNGLMRQTGLLLEFRHRELLDWYAGNARFPEPANPTSAAPRLSATPAVDAANLATRHWPSRQSNQGGGE